MVHAHESKWRLHENSVLKTFALVNNRVVDKKGDMIYMSFTVQIGTGNKSQEGKPLPVTLGLKDLP